MSYSKRDWEKLIRKIAGDASNVHFSKHALQQMKARHISNVVALDVLKKGNIAREPEPDIKTGHTVCRMERFSAGKAVTIAVALEDEKSTGCIVVTAFVIGE